MDRHPEETSDELSWKSMVHCGVYIPRSFHLHQSIHWDHYYGKTVNKMSICSEEEIN